MKKHASIGNIAKALAYVGGAIGGGGIAYGLGKGLDYNPIEKGISLASGAIGGLALPSMAFSSKLPIPKALAIKLGIAAAILGEAAPATIRSIRSNVDAQNSNKKFIENLTKWTTPALIGGGIGLGALGMTAVPALVNISRAADRIGDGRALRMSTSIRKRPNDPTDLKIEFMNPQQADEEAARYIAEREKQEEQQKGVLGKIFG